MRNSWRGKPNALLRGTSILFALATEVRNFFYDAGLLAQGHASQPVLSVGGLTVGGSGKTPLAAWVARSLRAAGHRPAILSRGFRDELELHALLAPGIPVFGHPNRCLSARTAVLDGADVLVLDDGFQHRRMARVCDLVLVDADALHRTNRRRLPAGPFREGFGALTRADAIVITARSAPTGFVSDLEERLRRRLPGLPVTSCRLAPGRARAANDRAAHCRRMEPSVALAGMMKPALFFEHVRCRWPSVKRFYTFRDHQAPRNALTHALGKAGADGIVTTLKDAVRIATRIGSATPLWYVEERLVWGPGARDLVAYLTEILRIP